MSGVVVRVDEVAIGGLFSNEGEIGRWAGRVSEEARVLASIRIHSRTGLLAASLQGKQTRYYTFGQRISVWSDVPYASFVNDGVDHPIVKEDGRGMSVPRFEGSAVPRMWRHEVAGQTGQHFLEKGVQEALGVHGILVPMGTPVVSWR